MKRYYIFLKIVYLIYIVTIPKAVFSQGIIVQSGGKIQASGSATIQITDGNFVNNGTYTSGTETFIMSGTSADTISGISETEIYNLKVSNTGGITTELSKLTANSLTIETGSKLTIDTTRHVNIITTITNNAGTSGILIKADPNAPNGSLIFHNAFESPVQASVEMYSKAYCTVNGSSWTNLKWQFFGVPVQTIAASPTFNGSYVRKYNETGNGTGFTTDKRWIQLTTSSSLTEVNGYEIVQPTGKTYTIKGNLVNSDISKTLTYTSTADYSGQHLFGNPYTSAIDITKINFGTQTEEVIYQYNTGSYDDWNTVGQGSSGTQPGQYTTSTPQTAGSEGIPIQIPSMQGFLVKAMSNSADATISIPYSTSTVKDTTQQRTPRAKKTYLIIDITGEKYSDRMWLFSQAECTRNFDNGWDGRKMYGSYLAPQLYGSEADDNYQIDVVDNINNTVLGLIAGVDSLYTLKFSHYNINEQYPSLYLEDQLTNTITDISEDGSTYSFKATNTTYSQDRFKIKTSPGISTETKSLELNNLFAYYIHGSIIVNNVSGTGGIISISDLSGRIIEELKLNPTINTQSFSINLNDGIYIYKIITKLKSVSKTFIVKEDK